MTTYEPLHRAALLEAGFALDHLVWCYRSELDRLPHFAMTADDICLHDFANRTASLVRTVLDGDNQRRGPRPQYKPSMDSGHRLRAAIEARRRARAEEAGRVAGNAPPAAPDTTEDVSQTDAPSDTPQGDYDEQPTVRCRRRPR